MEHIGINGRMKTVILAVILLGAFATSRVDALAQCPPGAAGCSASQSVDVRVTDMAEFQCPISLSRALSKGARGEDVSAVQRTLRLFGDYTYDEITGFFGSVTRQAVQRFQCRELGICQGTEATNGYGRIGPSTRAALMKACHAANAPIGEPVDQDPMHVPVPPAPSSNSAAGPDLSAIDAHMRAADESVPEQTIVEELDI